MKKSAFLVVILTALLLLSACDIPQNQSNSAMGAGSGNVVRQDVPVSGIDSVMLGGIGDLTIRQGETESLTIEAEESVLPYLETNIHAGELVLRTKMNANIHSSTGIHYTLVVKDLRKLEVAGLGDIDFDGLATNSLDLTLSGSGNVKLSDLQAQEITVTLSGLGTIELAGQTESLTMKMKGAGNLKAADLLAKNADIRIDGLGDATVQVADQLDARINGAGSLEYYGEPKITQEVTGLGTIHSLGAR